MEKNTVNLRSRLLPLTATCLASIGCSPQVAPQADPNVPEPRAVVDLGTLVTADLPERVWGKRFLAANDFDRPNAFDVIRWNFGSGDGSVSGSNAYYTLFNHGGPHVDAPNHVGLNGGVDSYPIESFVGPLKVFDASHYPKGRSIPVDAFTDGNIRPGDIVLMYTAYAPPETEDAFPEIITLMPDAADYLASIPVRAYGTDSLSVAILQPDPVDGDTPEARIVPIHNAFLSRGIPVYEQLFNVDLLLGKETLLFVGVPLNVQNGDGMVVRPVVFVY